MATRNQVDGSRLRIEWEGDRVELITRSGNNWTDFMREAARKVTPEALAARLEFQRAAFPAQCQLLTRLLARLPLNTYCVGLPRLNVSARLGAGTWSRASRHQQRKVNRGSTWRRRIGKNS